MYLTLADPVLKNDLRMHQHTDPEQAQPGKQASDKLGGKIRIYLHHVTVNRPSTC